MINRETSLQIYRELADRYDQARDAGKRDLFLVLAAEAALALGQNDQAERLLQRLLALNPHSLLKPYSSLAEALRSPDVQFYVEDLKRQFPPEKAERLLHELGGKVPAASPPSDVYRVQGQPPVLPKPAPPAPAPPAKTAAARIYGFQPPAQSAPRPDEDDAGSWFTWLLFLVLLAGGLALAWVTFLAPLLP
jgi:hypothetical protein